MTEKCVFVSYSHKDKSVVFDYVNRLQSRLGEIFWIDDELECGERYHGIIYNSISKSKVALFMLSANSKRSEWVEQEIAEAKRKCSRIVPICLDDASKIDGYMKFEFQTYNMVNSEDFMQFEKLVRDLSRWLNIPTLLDKKFFNRIEFSDETKEIPIVESFSLKMNFSPKLNCFVGELPLNDLLMSVKSEDQEAKHVLEFMGASADLFTLLSNTLTSLPVTEENELLRNAESIVFERVVKKLNRIHGCSLEIMKPQDRLNFGLPEGFFVSMKKVTAGERGGRQSSKKSLFDKIKMLFRKKN